MSLETGQKGWKWVLPAYIKLSGSHKYKIIFSQSNMHEKGKGNNTLYNNTASKFNNLGKKWWECETISCVNPQNSTTCSRIESHVMKKMWWTLYYKLSIIQL